MKVLCVIALFIVCAKGENSSCGDNVDAYLDKVLDAVKSEMPDPLPLSSREAETEKDTTLTEGVAWGVNTLSRTGPAVVTCDHSGVTIKAFLGVDEMTGRYRWEKYVLGRKRSGLVLIKADEFEVEVVVTQENKEDAKAVLEDFKVTKMKGIDVELTGINYVTWIASQLLDHAANHFEEVVAGFVEQKLSVDVARELANIRIPLN